MSVSRKGVQALTSMFSATKPATVTQVVKSTGLKATTVPMSAWRKGLISPNSLDAAAHRAQREAKIISRIEAVTGVNPRHIGGAKSIKRKHIQGRKTHKKNKTHKNKNKKK
jgi:hypothetical protein